MFLTPCPPPSLSLFYIQIDKQLDSSSVLLANIEAVFEMMKAKGDMVEEYVDFTHNPRLMVRFRQRIGEYKFYWKNIKDTTSRNVDKSGTTEPVAKMYSFVEDEEYRDGRSQEMSTPATSTSSHNVHATTSSPPRQPRTDANSSINAGVSSSAFSSLLLRNGSEAS